jgi:pimeloyl-ACP methyl ester carboxylesterase
LPAGQPPFPCVVFVHGLGSGKDSPRNVVVAERLLDSGIAAVLFDLSGHGQSDADARDGDEALVLDLDAVFHWASGRPEIDPQRIGVAGSGIGGVVALDATQRRLIRPAALVLRAPPAMHRDFAGVEAPSLVIVGSHDPLCEQLSEAVRKGDNCTISIVPGAGRLFEEPGTLAEAADRTLTWFQANLSGQVEVAPPGETGEGD